MPKSFKINQDFTEKGFVAAKIFFINFIILSLIFLTYMKKELKPELLLLVSYLKNIF